MSDAPFKGQTLLWNSVLAIASKELDSFDPELKEVACKMIAQVPPLITDLQQVSFKYLVNFVVQIEVPRDNLSLLLDIHISRHFKASLYICSANIVTS